MLSAIRAYLSRIDQRPIEQIEREIDDELASHIASLEDDLVGLGLSPDAARRQALSRFGNPIFYGRQCRDVALKERRMKTFAKVLAAAACGAVFLASAWVLWAGQQSANAALMSMHARLDEMGRAAGARTPAPARTAAPLSTWSVYITGSPVSRPGQYALPADGLSLRRLLAIAGVETRSVKSIVVRQREDGAQRVVESISGESLLDPAGEDRLLKPDDLITVLGAG